MTSASSPIPSAAAPGAEPSALAEIGQETLALCRRLFLQLLRRPST
ncbi:MAG: ABC transporter permease, partial [Cyanobacteriota bacterium]|nr:ABC transporter permease [Cyanobacteriota bacterium]